MKIGGDANPAEGRTTRTLALGLAGLVPALTTISLGLGLGLRSGAGLAASAAVAGALALLPAMGLASLVGGGRRSGRPFGAGAFIVALWIWSGAVWLMLPVFLPGARGEATRSGARVVLSPLPDALSGVGAEAMTALVSMWGDEGAAPGGPPLAHLDPEDPGTGPDAEDADATWSTPEATLRARAVPGPATDPGEPVAVVLPYEGDGRMLDIEVTLDGPDVGDRFRMIFDTGASFTTLTHEAIGRIDVRIPKDAPRVTLNTAGGPISAPLVLLDAVWLGDRPVEWVTVAVCDSCTAGDRAGLLGLNVSSQFRVEIDHARKRIHLEPRPGDRRHDVRAWVSLDARIVRHGDERLEVEVTLGNRAPRAIEAATVEVVCGRSGFAVQLTDVPARGEASSALSVPGYGEPDCEAFTLDLLTARWALDRF